MNHLVMFLYGLLGAYVYAVLMMKNGGNIEEV